MYRTIFGSVIFAFALVHAADNKPWDSQNIDPVAVQASASSSCSDSAKRAFSQAIQSSLTKNNKFSVHLLIQNGKKYGVLREVLDYVQYWKRQDIGMLEQ